MKVGVIGSGDVGKALAAGFILHGHEVVIGTREPAKLAEWIAQNPQAKAASSAEAARWANVVVLAVKGLAAAAALEQAGAENFSGKVVVDTCNPIADGPPVKGILPFFTTLSESLLEQLQKKFPAGRFVKAFNSVGSALMVNPLFSEGKPTMFICGNDAEAKRVVAGVCDEFGWEVYDAGEAESARAIEPLCMLWVSRGLRENQWFHAFKLLTK